MPSLKRKFTVRLHDTDAAGILFFARQFYYVHDAYEELLAKIGLPMSGLINHPEFFVPIVHAESQFLLPLITGEEVEIAVTVEKLGNTSYTLAYDLRNSRNDMVGSAKTVHVSVDRRTRAKIPLPQKLRAGLEAFQNSAK